MFDQQSYAWYNMFLRCLCSPLTLLLCVDVKGFVVKSQVSESYLEGHKMSNKVQNTKNSQVEKAADGQKG